MSKSTFALAIFALMSACAPRGEIGFAAPFAEATLHDISVARFRPTEPPAEGQRSPPRPSEMSFEHYQISIPPNHQTGQIEWPNGTPNARSDFVTIENKLSPSLSSFAQTIARADTKRTGTTLLYVHGYNYTHGEAVYQMAQIRHDFNVPSPTVLFSWPSAGKPIGYLYDRDSTLIARDQLEQLIIALTRDEGRTLEILGHSMGNLLIMETLRQIEISGSVDIPEKIAALFMVAPDIDGELFYAQASRLKALPRDTVILAAEQDRALRISAALTGRTNRLGSETDRKAVRDLPVSVVDTSELSNGGNDHSIAFTSPAAIAIINKLSRETLPGDKRFGPVVNLAGFR